MDNKNSKETEADLEKDLAETEELKPAAKAEAEVEKVEKEKVKAEEPKPQKPAPAPVANAVVSGGATDEVFLSRCVFKNPYARKSLTVHHVQRRLADIGYTVVNADKDGWYGDMTKLAVSQFQADNGLEGDGMMNAVTFEDLFAGDPNVTVVID